MLFYITKYKKSSKNEKQKIQELGDKNSLDNNRRDYYILLCIYLEANRPMKKFSTKHKFDYRHIIAGAITASFLLCSVFLYGVCFSRIIETIRDLWSSFKYYFCFLFLDDQSVTATVTQKSAVDFAYLFPVDFEAFKTTFVTWLYALGSAENFNKFIVSSSDTILILYTILLCLVVTGFAIKIFLSRSVRTPSNDYGTDTKPLKAFKSIENAVSPVIGWVKNFFSFCFSMPYKKLWLAIWLYNLNVFTIIGESVAYLFYLVSSFDFVNLYVQVYKLLFDVAIMFSALPWYIWCAVAIHIIRKLRLKKGYERLNRMEAYDTGFVKSLPTVNVIYGLMGGGKGQVMTDFVLTSEKIFRENAKEIMTKYDLMFPQFPWSRFEAHLRSLIGRHVIYSFATAERFIKWKKTYFFVLQGKRDRFYVEDKLRKTLYGYDFTKHGLYYDNKLYLTDVFEALETYAKAYYIYTTPEFKISNYAIRSDGIMEAYGNFPLWDYDFYSRRSSEIDEVSRYGKILDQDILRRGKKVDPKNPLSDTFEFGIVVMTELDKERGNQNVTKEMKISAEETNQKNDLFNFGLKLDRHPSTVDYTPFVSVFFDLQRISSTNADLQELGQHLGVGDKDKGLLALPFFFVEEFLYGLIFERFNRFYDEYRFYHGDNTLFCYLVKKVCGKFINYYRNTYNLFGYDLHRFDMENVTTHEITKHDYYLTYKKNHARRYYTDSLVDYFRQSALKKNKGLVDYPEYAGVKATREELLKQNAYFIQSLENVYNGEDYEKRE